MRRLGRFLKLTLIAFGGFVAFVIVLTVVLGLSGVLDTSKQPTQQPAVAAVPALAAGTPAPPNDPDLYVRYVFGIDPRSGSAIVWHDAKAIEETQALLASGEVSAEKGNLDVLARYMACLPDSGTRVEQLSIGLHSTTIEVEEGDFKGCRGEVDNSSLAKTRQPWLHSGE